MGAKFAGQMMAVIILVLAVIGWSLNLYELSIGALHFTPESNWAILLLRAIGVFVFPVGAFLGVIL